MITASLFNPREASQPVPNAAGNQFITNQEAPTLPSRFSDSGAAAKVPSERMLPDPTVCRAKPAGFGDYTDCLVAHPIQCPHSLSFGDAFLCRHPERKEIVLRSSTQGR